MTLIIKIKPLKVEWYWFYIEQNERFRPFLFPTRGYYSLLLHERESKLYKVREIIFSS